MFIGAILFQTMVFAQNTKVTSSFKKLYPTASDASWNELDDKNWQVEFSLNDDYLDGRFDINGTWIETTSSVDTETLSSAVKATIKKYGSEDQLSDILMVRKTTGEYYKVIIDTDDESITVEIDKAGKVLNESREKLDIEMGDSDDEDFEYEEE